MNSKEKTKENKKIHQAEIHPENEVKESEGGIEKFNLSEDGKEDKREKHNKSLKEKKNNPVEISDLKNELNDIKEKYRQLIQAKDDLEDLAKRQKAEFDNYRKRIQEEKVDLLRYGGEDFFKSFLTIVDAYEKALDIKSDNKEVNSFLEGFYLLKRQIDELLAKNGIKNSTQVNDRFDPSLHQAIQFVEEGDEEKVIEIYQKGYFFHEKIIRGAMVKITKPKFKQTKADTTEKKKTK